MRRTTADIKFSKMIRERDHFTCQRCGARHTPTSRGLHCAHLYTRRTGVTRLDPDNAIALCYGCHQYVDSHPEEKTELFRFILGPTRFDEVSARAHGRRDRALAKPRGAGEP